MRRFPVLALIACITFLGATLYRAFVAEVRDVESIGQKPTLIVELSEGASAAQVFSFPRSALNSISASLWSEQPMSIEIAFELRHRTAIPGAPDEPIRTLVETVSQPAGEAWHRFEFAPVPDSKDQTFVAVFRVIQATPVLASVTGRVTFGLMAWADDALESGRLVVGSRERWGDLAFFAQAEPTRRVDRLLKALDASLPQVVRLGTTGGMILAGLYWTLLLGVAVLAVSRVNREPPGVDADRSSDARWPRSLAAMALVLGTPALGWSLWAIRERVAIDLMRNLDTATMESPAGLHGAFGITEESINGYLPKALFAHPPSRITWRVSVPVGRPVLRTAVALRPYVWETRSDGVTFNVIIDDRGQSKTVYSRFVNPRDQLQDRAWLPVGLDLSSYAGRSIGLILETTPGPSGDFSFDWAMWAHPRIVNGP